KIEEEDESDTKSKGIPEAEKKFKQLAGDEEMARKYDFIQARIEADRLLALRLQDKEREQFTVEERAKFLHDTIAAQKRFLAEQRAIAIRNKPPTRTQLRNQMMTYLKHVGNKKHSDLKNKTFEDIQAIYEKVKRFDESFTAVGSTEDERRIKEMNEGVKDLDRKVYICKQDVRVWSASLRVTAEDVDRIFTLEEPFEEMGSEAIEVPALKDEEFAQITVLGLRVSFPNGEALSFVL
ncbi:hypothetical protein Tco_0007459, partial [Tanacetum coccineum]